jgi:synaptobrevin family protein YKT6
VAGAYSTNSCDYSPSRPWTTPTNTPRNSVREIGREINRTVAEATRPGTRQSKPEDQFTIHIYARSEGCAGIIVADQNYDKLVAHQLLSKILDEFTSKFPKSSWSNKAGLKAYQDGQTEGHLGWYIKEFQDPNNGDSIMKIQRELNETKETLQKAIQSTLERGEYNRVGSRTAAAHLFRGRNADPILDFRREARQSCRKVRQLERVEQDVLHTGKEAELVLRCHVNAKAVEAYELDGFARSICAAFGWVEQRLFSPQETLRTFRFCFTCFECHTFICFTN